MDTVKPRKPVLIIFGALGIWILVHLTDYAGYGLAAIFSGRPIVDLLSGKFGSPIALAGQGLGALLVGVPATLLALLYIWRRSAVETGLTWRPRPFLWGVALGVFLPTLILFVVRILGAEVVPTWSRIAGVPLCMAVAGQLAWSFFVAFLEEIVFRGIVFRELLLRWRWWPSAVIAGVVFAFAHMIAAIGKISMVEFIITFFLILLASILFCALYSVGRNLWLPIGFHWAWNFVLAAILGVCLSGQKQPYALMQTDISGPSWLIGNWFGIEVSLVTLALFLALTWWLRKRERVHGGQRR